MAFGFGAMTRLFKKGERRRIADGLEKQLPKIISSKDEQEFQNQHDSFCRWFGDNIRTVERKKGGVLIKKSSRASYGHGAKVLDVALKTFTYYCQLPETKTAKRIEGWLNAAIDTKMMKYLKGLPEGDAINSTTIEEIDKHAYAKLQILVRKDIKRNFPIGTLPVQWDDIKWRELNNK